MAKTNIALQNLTKEEFDEAYEAMLAEYADKLDKRPLPTKMEVLQIALENGQIDMRKFTEFNK